jgi:hypothetical protein
VVTLECKSDQKCHIHLSTTNIDFDVLLCIFAFLWKKNYSSSETVIINVSLIFYLFIYFSYYYGCTAGFLSFLILYRVGRTPWTVISQPQGRYPNGRATQTQNNHTQIFISPFGFEPTTPVFCWWKQFMPLIIQLLWSANFMYKETKKFVLYLLVSAIWLLRIESLQTHIAAHRESSNISFIPWTRTDFSSPQTFVRKDVRRWTCARIWKSKESTIIEYCFLYREIQITEGNLTSRENLLLTKSWKTYKPSVRRYIYD